MTADVHLVSAELNVSVCAVCRALRILRSTAYERRGRQVRARELARRRLDVDVAAIHRKHKGNDGARRIREELRANSRKLSSKSVVARIRRQSLAGKQRRRWRKTTVVDQSKTPAPNLLNRDFHRDRPNTTATD